MSKATMWKSRQRYVPKLVYSIFVLLLKNILVWRKVLYFMDGPVYKFHDMTFLVFIYTEISLTKIQLVSILINVLLMTILSNYTSFPVHSFISTKLHCFIYSPNSVVPDFPTRNIVVSHLAGQGSIPVGSVFHFEVFFQGFPLNRKKNVGKT